MKIIIGKIEIEGKPKDIKQFTDLLQNLSLMQNQIITGDINHIAKELMEYKPKIGRPQLPEKIRQRIMESELPSRKLQIKLKKEGIKISYASISNIRKQGIHIRNRPRVRPICPICDTHEHIISKGFVKKKIPFTNKYKTSREWLCKKCRKRFIEK